MRADTGTSVTEWLTFPVVDLPEWREIVADEQELMERELVKRRKQR
ncbi:MAG: hypothetical protein LBJ36_05040 [Synergistaceae bacterium]|nr:hypothetical protein [Synergistaceae bacterium]